MKKIFRFMALTLASAVICSAAGVLPSTAEESNAAGTAETAESSVLTYSQYKEKYSGTAFGKKLTVGNDNIVSLKSAEKQNNICSTGKSGTVIGDGGSAVWSFTVPNDALYAVSVEYAAAETGSGDLELNLLLDGKLPFDEVKTVAFNRTYEQPEGDFAKNSSGNEIKPDTKELLQLKKQAIADASGYESKPFFFFLSSGVHSIELSAVRGKTAITEILLMPYAEPISYEEYRSSHSGEKSADSEPIILEGEHFNYKNSVVVTPKTDRSSPITSPQSANETKLNTVGGSSWKTVGDSVTWKLNIKKAGLYKITLRARQNVVDGMYTTRKLYIDDEVPFKEAEALKFTYSSEWQAVTLGNDSSAYEFYLTEGEHTLTLEAAAGGLSENVGDVQYILNQLYKIYRRIVMITGSSPDTQRDYSFGELIPEEIKSLGEYADKLQKDIEYIDSEAGAKGSYTSVLKKVVAQLETMSSKPKTIAKNLEQFKSNLGAVSSWLLTAMDQPLEIDLIEVTPTARETTVKAQAGFFKNFAFSFRNFINSYLTDYSTIGGGDGENGKTVKVWIQSGRDQAEVTRELIDSDYSKKYNNNIKLSVVTGALLQSVLAGQAPDVVFDLAATDPMEYALRGAAYNLKKFDDWEQVSKTFSPAAVKAAAFEDGVYGMPQTFSFFMFFYRTDIFEEYGFTVPKTWDDIVSMIPTLQKNSMEFGLPHDLNLYTSLLYQRGSELYRDGGAKTNLDSNIPISTFVDFTDYFSLYDLSVTYDFANRFRSGEMPCAIADFSIYNQLTAFAPEIKGRWEMVPIPGTPDGNGNINNTSCGTATYIMLLESSKVKNEAWEFMKWFMSDEVQSLYSIKMESILGTCAKVATANVGALSKMTWSSNEYSNLFKQYESVDAVPQVPGGYYLSRMFTFAFNRVYNGSTLQNMGEDPSTVLSEYIDQINDELERKRAEFGR